MAGPEGTAVEVGRPGISRRDALKRGAVAGGAVLWVSPIVQNIGISKAWATHGSPHPGTGVSFVAFRFTCGGTTYFVKLENFSAGDPDGTCSGPNNSSTDNCGVDDDNAVSGCGVAGLFTVRTVFDGTDAVLVEVTLTCTGGTFIDGGTKCGNAHGGCHDVTPVGNVATFVCPD